MFLLNRSLGKLVTAPLHRFSHSNSFNQQFPFDLKNEDEKYRDFNQMYQDMFNHDATKHTNKEPQHQSRSDIDELNDETCNLLSVGYHKLTARELEERVKSSGKFVLQSLSNNPYFNLAIENYVFANTPVNGNNSSFTNQRLLFYINRDCVVIGKNQTVWKEVYLRNLESRGYELLRRFSGGGSVVHDLGNVNYSFLTSREEFRRDFFNELIVKSLEEPYPDLSLRLNSRGDITLNSRKVSGSAFKIAKGKSYHHGTMLIGSNLDQFHGLLKPDLIEGVSWKCNSVDSVRSEVTNTPLESPQQFIDACVNGFKHYFLSTSHQDEEIPTYYCDDDVTINDEIREFMLTLQSDTWKYMAGPKFELHLESGSHSISVEKGIIVDSTISEVVGTSFKEFTKKASEFNIDASLIL